MGRLQNKVAIVTGGGSGIGRTIAERFVSEGAKVIIVDINQKYLNSISETLNKRVKDVCIPKKCDVTNSLEVNEVIDFAWNKLGGADILVNNAGGSMNHSINLLDITEKMWDDVIDLNTKSVFLFSQSFIRKHVHNNSEGVIVNMASHAGRIGSEITRPHYSAAKSGVIGLSRHMAREFGPYGIRINAVAPGHCMSGERIEKLWESRDKESLVNNVALRRISSPEEQASVVLFLCADDSSYITGATIDVSGGLSCL